MNVVEQSLVFQGFMDELEKIAVDTKDLLKSVSKAKGVRISTKKYPKSMETVMFGGGRTIFTGNQLKSVREKSKLLQEALKEFRKKR